jgi:hypothetical protein
VVQGRRASTRPVVLVVVALSALVCGRSATAQVISGCVKKSGALRVLTDPTKSCKKRETAITWNQVGPQGTPGADGTDGAPGTPGDQGPPGPSTGAAGGDLIGSFPNPSVRLATSSVDPGQTTAVATSCTTLLTSVTLTVPPSGYVEVLAKVDLRANSNTAIVCVAATGIPSQQIMSTNSLTFETRYTVRGSTSGTTLESAVEWLPFFVTPGALTISIYGGHTISNNATFENAVLLVRAIS